MEFELESHPSAKHSFLTTFSKSIGPTIIEELETWQANSIFQNSMFFLFCFIPG